MGRACSKFAQKPNDIDAGGLLPRDRSDGVCTSENTPVAMGGVAINVSEEGVVVIVRIRPKSSKEEDQKTCLRVQGPMQLDITGIEQPQVTKTFNFDAVLPEVTTQDQVFSVAGPKLIENALKGFNTTMIAYGQTGSGKTFTMEGSKRDPGMIPRLCKGLFEAIGASEAADRTSVSASYIEIYLESIRDLLDPNGSSTAGAWGKLSPRSCSGSSSSGGSSNSASPVREGRSRSPCRSQSPISIRENKDGVYIENVTTIKVDSEAAVLALLAKGSKARSVGETQMNLASSRSHAVLTLSITQTSTEGGAGEEGGDGCTSTITSKISLVDLAGSERAKSTGAAGQRLKEGVQINKSLSALGNVIKALTSGSTTHVPYRDSKLTRLLQDSLGGTAYTVVCCNVSPIEASEPETLSTLRFAERLKKVKNKMVVHMDAKSKELQALKRENAELRAKVEELERMLNGGAAVQTMGYKPMNPAGRGIRATVLT